MDSNKLKILFHDLSNNFMVIGGFAELTLELNNLSEATAQRINTILKVIEKSKSILNEIKNQFKEDK